MTDSKPQRCTLRIGQYVILTKLPPPDPNGGGGLPGLEVGHTGIVRQIGHDADNRALVQVDFVMGGVWVYPDALVPAKLEAKHGRT